MTTPMLMTQHLTEETLAAYIDDRLDSATREPVTKHLASCGECREIVLMTTAYQADEESAKVTRGNFGGSWSAFGGLAAAAAIVVMAVQPNSLFFKDLYDRVRQASTEAWDFTVRAVTPGQNDRDLVAAYRNVAVRTSMGRLAGSFRYAAKPVTNRGPSENEVDFNDDYAAKAKLMALAAELADAKPPDPYLVGLSRLLIATTRPDFDEAVANLAKAHEQATGAKRDAIATDLAAALIGRARWSANDEDYRYALRLSEDVLTRKQSPAALWNRAVAIEYLNTEDAAVRAWDDYLKVDSKSEWAEEATQNKTRLQSLNLP